MADRHAPSFSLGNKLARVAWGVAWTALGRWTPPPLWAWRRQLLRAFGASVGPGVRVYNSTRVWLPANLAVGRDALIGPRVRLYNQGRIAIGEHAVISQDASLCASTHNVEDPGFPLLLRPIEIGAHAWIAAEAFVGPGVTIGEGAVIGARCVAMRDCAGWTYYTGNPAVALKERPKPAAA